MKGASIEATDNDTETPLYLAPRNGQTGMVELILSKGVSIEARNIYSSGPVIIANF